jgi:predicted RNA-binding Zn-ribbon protein involved in translation (DUF1610 family)
MTRPALEVAQIFCHHGPDYRENQRLSPVHHKTMRAIERCRTARLGGHVDSCSQGCGYLAISYNSCRNRHCPKCQSLKQAKWLAERLERLLPTHYFHLVVTLPHELNPLALYNPELVFNLLFEAASRALLQFARDYERLRAQIGFTAVLHTWDQELNSHHHLHLVVTGGGLSEDGERWIAAGNSFLLPVRELSKIIRGKFLEGLEKAFREARLKGGVPCLEDPVQFQRFTRKLRRKKWVVYAKGSFGGSQKAYHYLSRYTHRVAISNHRLVSLAEGKVIFRARDNSRPGQKRLVNITAQEFIRRFLLHVLPPRFVKIRHYGLMAPCNAKTKLEKARALLSLKEPLANNDLTRQKPDTPSETKTWQEMLQALTGIDLTTCPNCGQGRLIRYRLIGSEATLAPTIWDSS